MRLHTTKVFAKAGLEIETSAACKHQQRFGLDPKQLISRTSSQLQ
jgi:hypothetical protein